MKGIFDSACRGFGTYSDVVWFFKDDKFLRYLIGSDSVDPPAPRDILRGSAATCGLALREAQMVAFR